LGVAQPLAIPFYIGAFVVREYTFWMVGAIQKRFKFGKLPLIPLARKESVGFDDKENEVYTL